jgi:hypothetical protein
MLLLLRGVENFPILIAYYIIVGIFLRINNMVIKIMRSNFEVVS